MTSRVSKALVFSAVSALGVATAAGCGGSGSSSGYCDTTGCYQCDAYGCSMTTGPNGDIDASASYTPTTDASTGTDLDAGTVADATAPVVCAGTTCAAGDVCVNQVCTAPANACQFTSQCATGKLCADGACLDPCNPSDGTCATGFTCSKGVCEPNGGGTGGDGGVAPPTSCTTDQACGTGKYCNNDVCVIDTRPQPNCTQDSDCGGTAATPKKCLAGYCKYTCTTDQYCRTIDSRIGYCATDGVCRSSTEANPQCTGPGTCPLQGQSCIDNQCK